MIDYLYYVKNMIKDANIERKEFLMSKIESHISQWLHYKNCKGRSPLHPEEFVSGNFIFQLMKAFNLYGILIRSTEKVLLYNRKNLSYQNFRKL
jgi:hypothetical protein